MKRRITNPSMALALLLASFASQGLAQTQIAGSDHGGWQAFTKTTPAVAIDNNGTKYAAWNLEGSNQILVATQAANSNSWALLGSSLGGPGVVGGTNWTAGTNASPALSYDSQSNRIWLAYKGQSSPSDRIWFSRWTGTKWTQQAVVIPSAGGTPMTGAAPALGGSAAGQSMVLAWKGASSDDIWTSFWNGSAWTQQETVSGTYNGKKWTAGTSTTPVWVQPISALSTSGTQAQVMLMFWKGGGSKNIWMGGYRDNWFGGQVQVSCPSETHWPAFQTNSAPAAAYYNLKENGLYTPVLFWANTDGVILFSYDTGIDTPCYWSEPTQLPGSDLMPTNAAPAVVFPFSSNDPYYFIAWQNAADNTVWYETFDTLQP
jgi:hypothetical protein